MNIRGIDILTVLVGIVLLVSLISVFTVFDMKDDLNLLSGKINSMQIVENTDNELSEDMQPSAGTGAPDNQQEASQGGTTIDSLIGDDPTLGSDDAPVILIEFSDFQCPFCRKFWSESFSNIKTEYMDSGKVQFVYKDFPLGFHPAAQKSAEAAQCANDQGKWLEMHDKMYEEQAKLGQGTVQYSTDDLKDWAEDIGLNMNEFNDCLDSGKYSQEVQDDLQVGSSIGIQGTPGFVIGKRGGSPQLIVGAQPYATFKSAIDSLLNE